MAEENKQNQGENKGEKAEKVEIKEKPEKDVETKKEEVKQDKKEVKKEEKEELPDIKPGMTIRVHQKIREVNPKGEEKERIQVFEGIVLARKHGNTPKATITVRKTAEGGIGVEKIFPIHSPIINKIEVVKQVRTRRSKLYFLRRGYKKRLKDKKTA